MLQKLLRSCNTRVLFNSTNGNRLGMLQQCASASMLNKQTHLCEDQIGRQISGLCHCTSVTARSAASAPDSLLEVQTQAPPGQL